jgi:hypothetical protein
MAEKFTTQYRTWNRAFRSWLYQFVDGLLTREPQVVIIFIRTENSEAFD